MDRRKFIRNASLSFMALSLNKAGNSNTLLKDNSRKKIAVGGHVWVNFLKEYRNQIPFLHLRDQLSNGKWPESIGEGNVDFKVI